MRRNCAADGRGLRAARELEISRRPAPRKAKAGESNRRKLAAIASSCRPIRIPASVPPQERSRRCLPAWRRRSFAVRLCLCVPLHSDRVSQHRDYSAVRRRPGLCRGEDGRAGQGPQQHPRPAAWLVSRRRCSACRSIGAHLLGDRRLRPDRANRPATPLCPWGWSIFGHATVRQRLWCMSENTWSRAGSSSLFWIAGDRHRARPGGDRLAGSTLTGRSARPARTGPTTQRGIARLCGSGREPAWEKCSAATCPRWPSFRRRRRASPHTCGWTWPAARAASTAGSSRSSAVKVDVDKKGKTSETTRTRC